ncbi:MAG: flavin reductase (DIM6/NTAB) family NADH-FMN oxidoreductase RutF [Alphaproteobacteria bacterium]|jgi:flavin reductase (DIM6/NTAB) family NADH-FMN oxidoreductase RutF
MLISLQNSTPIENYKALTGAVLPRPLMWILTEGEKGCTVAPYSFVNIVSTEPPFISIAFGRKTNETELSGTLKTLSKTGKAVLHLTTNKHLDSLQKSAVKGAFVLDDENLTRELDNYPPRIKDCPVALFCEFYDIIDIEYANTHLAICTVTHIYKEEGASVEMLEPLTCVGESGIITLKNEG